MQRTILTALTMTMILGFAGSASTQDALTEAKKHFSFARQHRDSGNLEEAAAQYEQSISYCDTLYQVHYFYGDLLVKMNEKEHATTAFLRVLALAPDNYNAALMLSKLYHEAAKYDSSLVMLERMHTVKPENTSLLEGIAGLREYLGRDLDALAAYDELTASGAQTRETLVKAARLSMRLDLPEKSRAYAVMALDRQPGDIDALGIAARASVSLGQETDAADYLRRIVEQQPDLALIEQLETIYRAISDTDNLIWVLERHHELAPDNVSVIGELAEHYYTRSDEAEAMVCVRKGLALNPGDGRFNILLGQYHLTHGREQEALTAFRTALHDERWQSSAQRFIWQIQKPESIEQRAEREFFDRGKTN